MAKATVEMKSGVLVTIEGTQEEVAALLMRLEGRNSDGVPPSRSIPRQAVARATPMKLLSELVDAGFFAKPKELGAVRGALEEQGHFYPATTLSPIMLRLVRRRGLRRIKEKNRWLYVR